MLKQRRGRVTVPTVFREQDQVQACNGSTVNMTPELSGEPEAFKPLK